MNRKAVDRLTGAEKAVEEIRARRAKLWQQAGGTAEGYLKLIREMSDKRAATSDGRASAKSAGKTAGKSRTSSARKRRAATPKSRKKPRS